MNLDLKNIGRRPAVFRVTREADLSSLPLVYFPYVGLEVNIHQWSTSQNSKAREYFGPDFLECGCAFSKRLMLASVCLNVILYFILGNYFYNDLYHWFKITLVITMTVALTAKTLVVVFSRIALRYKMKQFAADNRVIQQNIAATPCRCG